MNFWKVADLWHTLMTRILGWHRNPQVSGHPVLALLAVQNPCGSAWGYRPSPWGRLTTPFSGEIRPGRGRRKIILVG
jgi:hypothetical protein